MPSQSYRLTDRGLQITGTISRAEWKEIGQKLSRHFSGIQWAIGDWLLALPKKGTWKETFAAARVHDILPNCYPGLLAYHKTARVYPHAQRIFALSWSFYRVAVALDPEQRMTALAEAARMQITQTEFVQWVNERMLAIPDVRVKNPRDRGVGRGRGKKRNAGEVVCPHCGGRFRVNVSRPAGEQTEAAA